MASASALPSGPADRTLFAGIFCVAFGTLLFELSLMRILRIRVTHVIPRSPFRCAVCGVGEHNRRQ